MNMYEAWELFKKEKPNKRVMDTLNFLRVYKYTYMQRFWLLEQYGFDELAVMRELKLRQYDIDQVKSTVTTWYILGLPTVLNAKETYHE